MRGWYSSENTRPRSGRRGMGAAFFFVVWVVSMAVLWAMMQSGAQGEALEAVARVTGLRLVTFAGETALEEASHSLRFPRSGGSTLLESVEGGGDTGVALDPVATRDIYANIVPAGTLTVSPVQYDVASRPPTSPSTMPWLIDLSVRVTFETGSVRLSREVRRRFSGRQHVVTSRLGRRKGEVLLTSLEIRPESLLQLVLP